MSIKTWDVNSRSAQLKFAAQIHGVPEEQLIVGVHIGPAEPNGVGTPDDFQGYIPFRRVDAPIDGWNDGAKYVVYFTNVNGAVYKAVNADPATLRRLTSGSEYEYAVQFLI
jgi:hypothetical protein